jgi:hypothetical protein
MMLSGLFVFVWVELNYLIFARASAHFSRVKISVFQEDQQEKIDQGFRAGLQGENFRFQEEQ